MNRRSRTILVVAIGVLLASVASAAVYRAILRIPERQVEVAHTFVVVAARSLPIGASVSSSDVKLAAWPSRNPVPGSLSDVNAAVNRGLIAPVLENEPVTESKLAPKEAGAGLAPTITAGMRAVSVKVNEVIGVAGFVVPGARVDVVVTIGQDKDSMTRTVVSNVQVLTAGTRYDQEKSKDGKPIPSTVVTLLVTPPDAERIVLASAEGKIVLTLRNPLDVRPTDTTGIRTAGLMGQPAAAPVIKTVQGRKVAVAVPPPVKQIYTVEAIRAAKRTEETVR